MPLVTLCKQSALENKPTIFFTGRVHCGETPASYMLQGVIDLLTKFGDVHSNLLLENYVFKIVPFLNPDGVSRGYWRFDTLGLNLNRHYKDPQPHIHPTIHATKQAIVNEHREGRLKMYVDFHAHCTKRSCFIFGNTLGDPVTQLEAMMIPKLMSHNCVNFDFRECNFSDEKNNVKDKKGDSRDGSGRAAIFRATEGNPYIYTFEANYATGIRSNTLSQRYNVAEEKFIVKDFAIHDTTSTIYRGKKSPIFNQEIFFDVGQSLLIALLDYDCLNPITRIIKKKGETLAEANDRIRREFRKQEDKPTMAQIKAAAKKNKKKKVSKMDNFELVMKAPPEEYKK